MTQVTLKGNPIQTSGELPAVGSAAPDFQVIKSDLSPAGLADYAGKVRVLVAVPSLDTAVCQAETRKFNEAISGKDGAVALVISGDLPFAMKRFCETEGLNNVITGSQFRDFGFAKAYGTLMTDGPLQNLSARAVFVVDKNDKIVHSQLVPEITAEPDYDAVMAAVDAAL